MSIFNNIIESFIRNISGSAGRRIRYVYYRKRLAGCGTHVFIDEGVYFLNPINIFLGNHIWIDKNVVLIAGKVDKGAYTEMKELTAFTKNPGEIHIGSYSHVGIGTIIQGHGGVEIGNYFTSSAGCKIYTLSNDTRKCLKGTFGHEDVYYLQMPVKIGNNVWLGLNVCVLGNEIGDNCFIGPNLVIKKQILPNKHVSSNPEFLVKDRFSQE